MTDLTIQRILDRYSLEELLQFLDDLGLLNDIIPFLDIETPEVDDDDDSV